MPTPSLSTLIQAAIEPAHNDRVSLAEAYGEGTEPATEANALATRIRALRGVPLRGMTPGQLEIARLALVYAEQWETSLADAIGSGPDEVLARKAGAKFRKARIARFGLTRLEAEVAKARPVDVRSMFGGRAGALAQAISEG